jgi:hypothetical protein
MSPKRIHQPPQPITKDINPDDVADCNKLDKIISECVNVASINVEKDLKDEFPNGSNIRFAGFLKQLLETHEVIRHIFRNFSKDDKPHQLSAMPLARQQVEFVFHIAFFLRDPEKLSNFERDTLTKIYKRFMYETGESKDLPRFQEGTKQRGTLIRNWMLGNGQVPLQQPFTKDELKNIEDFVDAGDSLKKGWSYILALRTLSKHYQKRQNTKQSSMSFSGSMSNMNGFQLMFIQAIGR